MIKKSNIRNLKPPFQAIGGQVCDADGKAILKANRESGETPLIPSERDDLIRLVVELLNKEYPVMKESLKTLNEAQIGDKVALGKEQGYIIGQTSDKQWIVQIQGSTKTAKDKEVKVLKGFAQGAMEPPIKFDDKTQKVLFEQYIRCGVFYGNVPLKTTNCYIKYSDYLKSNDTVNILVEGQTHVLLKDQVKLFENPNDFANPGDYVPAVTISETGEASGNILVHAGDYSQAVGDAEAVRVIFGPENENPEMGTLPKGAIRTLSV